jgi:hypothetical protein
MQRLRSRRGQIRLERFPGRTGGAPAAIPAGAAANRERARRAMVQLRGRRMGAGWIVRQKRAT